MIFDLSVALGVALILLTAIVVTFVAFHLDKVISRTFRGAAFAGTMIWICTMECMSLFSYVGYVGALSVSSSMSTDDRIFGYVFLESMGLIMSFTLAGVFTNALFSKSQQKRKIESK